jgi:hypothetical protein
MRMVKRGTTALRYSEILRLIGQYIERSNLGEIRILETDEGLILQGTIIAGPKEGERETYQLTPEDISSLMDDAHAMRGKRV